MLHLDVRSRDTSATFKFWFFLANCLIHMRTCDCHRTSFCVVVWISSCTTMYPFCDILLMEFYEQQDWQYRWTQLVTSSHVQTNVFGWLTFHGSTCLLTATWLPSVMDGEWLGYFKIHFPVYFLTLVIPELVSGLGVWTCPCIVPSFPYVPC